MPDLFAITYLNDQAEAFPNFNGKKMLQKLIKERLYVFPCLDIPFVKRSRENSRAKIS